MDDRITMRIGTLFSGIGSPEQGAMRVYGDDLELVFACEWDKFARESFKANYSISDKHFHKDISDMDGTKYKGKVDCIVGGSPCQDFSLAGLRKGIEGNRGILIYEYIRIIEEVQPPIFIYENVKGMLSDKGGKTIKDFVQAFREIGYYCHYEVLNTKDYGVPQNRERIFLVGFKDSEHYHNFSFAPKVKLEKRLKDVLEDDVDEKYYISQKQIDGMTSGNSVFKERFTTIDPTHKDYSFCLDCRCGGGRRTSNFIKEPQLKQIGVYKKEIVKRANETPKEINQFLKDNKGKYTLRELSHLTNIPKTTIEHYFRVDKSRAVPSINDWNKLKNILNFDNRYDLLISETESKISTFESTSRVYNDEVAPTLTCGESSIHKIDYRIRKLTPRECFRLQDFPDDFKFVVSNSQLYKQAGNSISVNMMEMIFNQIEKSRHQNCIGGLFG
jgi:DNA (cytosine-5)-methyltransferase 1